MTTALQIFSAVICGMAAAPLGLLPSILFFRELADGKSVGPGVERAYTFTLWTGLALAVIAGATFGVVVASLF